MHLVRATPLNPGVPASFTAYVSPLFTPGTLPTLHSLSYTAATPIALDDAPLCLRIKLVGPSPCRTSQPISGHIHIFGPPESKPNLSPTSLDISHLLIRIYYESRSTFWEIRPVNQRDRASIIQRIERVRRHEVHRGVVAGSIQSSWPTAEPFTISLDETLLGRPHAPLPFSFTLPPKMDVTESTHHNGLCSFMRCPPPSFSDSDTSVEWVVEAIMEVASRPRTEEHVSTKDGAIVSRLVFPVVPSGLDVGDLRSEPFFGEDVGADLAGARFSSGPVEGFEECYSKVMNVHGRSVESELYVPTGATVPRDTLTLPMRLSLGLSNTPAQIPILGLFRKPKPIIAHHARCSLHRSISTRGGHDPKPHTTHTLVRQCDINFSGASEALDLAVADITLALDLQTDGTYSIDTDRLMIPLSALVPSFRTPNIQLEYVLTVSVLFVGDTREHRVARFPLQIIPESVIPGDKLHNPTDSKLSL